MMVHCIPGLFRPILSVDTNANLIFSVSLGGHKHDTDTVFSNCVTVQIHSFAISTLCFADFHRYTVSRSQTTVFSTSTQYDFFNQKNCLHVIL
jgi:hypothetical protein